MARHTLGTSIASNANYPDNNGISWHGGVGTLDVTGTLTAATATLQTSIDGGTTWIAVGSNTTLTAVGVANFELGRGNSLSDRKIRLNVAGVSGDSFNAYISDNR